MDSQDTMSSKLRFWRGMESLFLGLLILSPLAFDPWGILDSPYKSLHISFFACLLAALVLLRPLMGCTTRYAYSLADLLWFLFLLYGAASIFWAINEIVLMQRLILLCAASVAYYMIRIKSSEGESLLKYIVLMVVVGTLVALVDGAAILFFQEGGEGIQPFKVGTFLFPHNNVASVYTILLIPLACSFLFGLQKTRNKILSGLALLILLGYLTLLESRAAMVEALLGLVCVSLFLLFRQRLYPLLYRLANLLKGKPMVLILAALCLIVFLLPLSEDFSAWGKTCFVWTVDVLGLDYNRSFFRLDIWRKTMVMVEEHLWQGVGLANFPVVFPIYHLKEKAKAHPHSEYFNVLAELGVVGMVLYLLFLLRIFKAFVHCLLYSEGGGLSKPLIFGVGCALLMEAVHGFFEPPMIFAASLLNMLLCSSILISIECRTLKKPPITWTPRGIIRKYILPVGVAACLAWLLPWFYNAVTIGRDLDEAQALYKDNRFEDAEQRYRRVADKGWDGVYIRSAIGNLRRRQGNYQEAYEIYLQAESLSPYSYSVHFNKGLALLNLGKPDEAVESLQLSLKYHPHSNDTKLALINALLTGGREDEAFSHLDTYMRSRIPTREECYEAAKQYFTRYETNQDRTGEEKRAYLLKALMYAEASLRKGGEEIYSDLRRKIKYYKYCIHLLDLEEADVNH